MSGFWKCVLYAAALALLAHPLGQALPGPFDPEKRLFRSRKWEQNGRIYTKLAIDKWKKLVPDMSRIVLWIARPFLENLSTPHTSLTRCFDTSIPSHTNLLRLPGATGAPLRTTVDKLCALKASKDYGSDLLAQSALVELMVGLNRAAAERGDARPTGTSDQVVDAVLHYINEHYSEALTLDQLSEKFFISKYHLLRKFDAQVGTTVHRYILQKRLLNAKQLLAGGVPPNEVCQYCGFGDYANFYRAFRAEYNQTPRQYIQSARGK